MDDEISRVRRLRQRSDDVAQSLAQPDTTLSVANIPNGGHGIGDNRKLAEIFMDEVYEDVGDVPVVSVIVMEAKGLRNDRAYVTYASAEAAERLLVQRPGVLKVGLRADELFVEIDSEEPEGDRIVHDLYENGIRVEGFRCEEPDLEDLFLSLTEGELS